MVKVLRWVLVVQLLAVAFVAVALEVSTAEPTSAPVPVPVEEPAAARSVFLVGGGVSCSGTLVGPDVVLTAAHCVRSSSGELRSPMSAHFEVSRFEPGTLSIRARLSCRAARVWTPVAVFETGSSQDWAVMGLGECRDREGLPTQNPGELYGYNAVADFGSGQRDGVYVGYPGGTGTVQVLWGRAGYTPPALRLFRPTSTGDLACIEGGEISAGGSGGGLLAADESVAEGEDRVRAGVREVGEGSVVVGVNNFMALESHACFRKVDVDIRVAVAAASAGNWPRGTELYAHIGR